MPDSYRLRILILETDPQARNSLAILLADLGHWVESVPDAATTLERSRQDGFDVLLTSLWQPGEDGTSLLGELAAQGRLPARVIAMGSTPLAEAGPHSQAGGCHGYLAKPFSTVELEAALA